jgi:hypothetical protein
MGNPSRVEGGTASNNPVDLISLLEQQLGQVGAVLARDTGDEGHTASSVRHRRTVAARCHAGDSAMLEHIFHDGTVLCGRIGTAGDSGKGLSSATPPVVFVGVQDTCVGRHIQTAIIRKVNGGRGWEKDPILISPVLLYLGLLFLSCPQQMEMSLLALKNKCCVFACWRLCGYRKVLYELYDNTAVWGESRLHSSGTRQGNYRALISNK